MTHAEYADYVRDVHGGLSAANKLTLRKYVQNHVFDSGYGAIGDTSYEVTLPRDSVTELFYDDRDSLLRGLADPYIRDVIAPDALNFSDLSTQLNLFVEETRTQVPNPGPKAVKVLYFLKAAEGLAPEEFQRRRQLAYEHLLADASGPARYLRGHEWNAPVAGDSVVSIFRRSDGSGQPAYDGYAALWFDEADALTGFRACEAALAAHADEQGAFYEPSLSFFLLTKEIVIFDDTASAPEGDNTR